MSYKKGVFVSNSLSYAKEEIKNKETEVIYFDFCQPLNTKNNDYKYNSYYILYSDFENKMNRFDNYTYINTKYGFIKYKLYKKKRIEIHFFYKNDLNREELVDCCKLIEYHIAGYEDFENCDSIVFSNSVLLV